LGLENPGAGPDEFGEAVRSDNAQQPVEGESSNDAGTQAP